MVFLGRTLPAAGGKADLDHALEGGGFLRRLWVAHTTHNPPQRTRKTKANSSLRVLVATCLAVLAVPLNAALELPSDASMADSTDDPQVWVPMAATLPPGVYVNPNETIDAENFTIGPGAFIVVQDGGGLKAANGCTANWVWKDQNGKVYLGTAGHCVLRADEVATHGPGNDTDAATRRVTVCANPCPVGGGLGVVAGNVIANEPLKGNRHLLGKVAYARQDPQAFDNDFALIEIPQTLLPMVSPRMPMWGGPSQGVSDIQNGDLLAMHGNGLGVGETYATKSRQGVYKGLGFTGTFFTAEVWSSNGDSGAPAGLILADHGGGEFEVGAAGILTACPVDDPLCESGVAVPGPHRMRGPTFPRLLDLALQANLCLRLVLETETAAGAPSGAC